MLRNFDENKKRKILFGSVDIGFRIEQYEEFISKYYADRLDAESISIFAIPKKHYKTNYTYEFSYFSKSTVSRYFLTIANFLRFFSRYDIFHFFSGESLLTRRLRPLEFKIYKLLGKRLVLNFVGSDLRSEDYLKWKSENLKQYLDGQDDFPKTSVSQDKLIADANKYGDYILVSTPDLIELIPNGLFFPATLNLDKFLDDYNRAEPLPKAENEIVILHVPSNIALKGTPYIKNIAEAFAKKHGVKIRVIIPEKSSSTSTELVHTTTRYELFKLFKTADIVIDQLVIGWYGLQSVEALAVGKEVICYIDKKLEKYLYPDCPIHNADLNTLEKTLEKCVRRIEEKQTEPGKQLDWVRKYHTIEKNHKELLEAWQLPD